MVKGFRTQKSLRQVVARLTAGNLAYLGAQFLSFLALAQWTSMAEVGRFSWALALTSPIFVLADMRTRQVQLATTAKEFSYRSVLVQRIVTQLIALPIAVLLSLTFAPDRETMNIVLALTLLKSIEGLMNVSIGEHLRSEHAGKVAMIQLARGVLYGGTFSLVIFITSHSSVAILITAIALLIPLVVAHLSLTKNERRLKASSKQIAELTRQAWPLGIGFFIGSLTVNGPRFLIEIYHGVESLAVFTAVAYVIVLANTVVDSVTQGIMPRFAGYWRTGRGNQALAVTKRIGVIVACLGATGLVLAVLFGDNLLVLLYGESYGTGQLVLIALFCYATIQYVSSTLRSTLIAGGMRKGVLWTSVVNLVITMGIASIWVPQAEPDSAGWSLAIGQAAQLIIYVSLAKRRTPGNYQRSEEHSVEDKQTRKFGS